VADNNNAKVGKLPKAPHPALKALDRLVGDWKIEGPDVDGRASFEWMEGGFFLVQHFDLVNFGERHKGVEYATFDEDTGTVRSHLIGTDGSNFTYTYEIEGDRLIYWFGDKDSGNCSRATFSRDGRTLTGRWQWTMPDGKSFAYDYTMTRAH